MKVLVSQPQISASWLHRWAVFTVCATLVLLALGAVVTTFNVGMADPIWPTYPWHLLLISWVEPKPGFLIEHSHRLAGYIVGCCIIVLAVGLWRTETRRWLRWLGVAALGGVIIQGLLGGFRVKLDEWIGPNLALIHGSFASVVFSLLASLALFTSRGWTSTRVVGQWSASDQRLRYVALVVSGLVFVQIVFGAILRHTYSSLGQRAHLLIAFAVAGGVVWLTRDVFSRAARNWNLSIAAMVLILFVAVQLLLGTEAWMMRFLTASAPAAQALVRTSHVLMGHLILATSVVATLHIWRLTATATVQIAADPVHQLEGAA
jgi:cytochrome c oxidase assembly protein subunit 15